MFELRYFYVFSILVLVTVILIDYFSCLNLSFHKDKVIKKSQSSVLLATVLSAPSNFGQRNAIRKSWGRALQNSENVHYKFFIGKNCMVPVLDRLDEFSCNEANILKKDLHSSTQKRFWGNLSCNDTSSKEGFPFNLLSSPCYSAFGFQVVHPLILTSIGIQWQLIQEMGPLRVTFKDAEEVFEDLWVSEGSCSLVTNGFCFVPLEREFVLPKSFEGEIALALKRELTVSRDKCVWTTDDCFRFTFGKTESGYEKHERGRCSFVVANFSVADEESLEKHLNEKSDRFDEWSKEQDRIEEDIKKEMKQYGDIVYLPHLTDVYKNLPLKLLEAFKWSHLNYPESAVMKLDDDTYVNASFLSLLSQQVETEAGPAIWSRFHYHRTVPLFGKWADSEFQGLTYPPFPSGSGYLVSQALVSLLCSQSSSLRPFQGEDISMGVWTETLIVSGEGVRKVDVACWMPSQACNESFLLPDLTPQRMVEAHRGFAL